MIEQKTNGQYGQAEQVNLAQLRMQALRFLVYTTPVGDAPIPTMLQEGYEGGLLTREEIIATAALQEIQIIKFGGVSYNFSTRKVKLPSGIKVQPSPGECKLLVACLTRPQQTITWPEIRALYPESPVPIIDDGRGKPKYFVDALRRRLDDWYMREHKCYRFIQRMQGGGIMFDPRNPKTGQPVETSPRLHIVRNFPDDFITFGM